MEVIKPLVKMDSATPKIGEITRQIMVKIHLLFHSDHVILNSMVDKENEIDFEFEVMYPYSKEIISAFYDKQSRTLHIIIPIETNIP